MRALHWRGFWLSGGAALVLLVTFLCLRPSTGGEQLFPNADKWAHFLAFFALAGMLLAPSAVWISIASVWLLVRYDPVTMRVRARL